VTARSLLVAPRIDLPIGSALSVWAVLLAVAVATLIAVAALARWQDPAVRERRARRKHLPRRPTQADYERLTAEARELARQAAVTAERARQAAIAAAEADGRRAAAQRVREMAGRTLDVAYDVAVAAEASAIRAASVAEVAARALAAESARAAEEAAFAQALAEECLAALRRRRRWRLGRSTVPVPVGPPTARREPTSAPPPREPDALAGVEAEKTLLLDKAAILLTRP